MIGEMKPTLDSFTRAYLVCALWSSNDESTPQGGEPFDRNYDLSDLAPEAVALAIADCARFQADNAADLSLANLADSRAGHCFWLNRNGHGSGFWDEYGHRDPVEWREACNRLSKASKGFGECNPYLGDDGQIYFA